MPPRAAAGRVAASARQGRGGRGAGGERRAAWWVHAVAQRAELVGRALQVHRDAARVFDRALGSARAPWRARVGLGAAARAAATPRRGALLRAAPRMTMEDDERREFR